jgi:hypothetical protein
VERTIKSNKNGIFDVKQIWQPRFVISIHINASQRRDLDYTAVSDQIRDRQLDVVEKCPKSCKLIGCEQSHVE